MAAPTAAAPTSAMAAADKGVEGGRDAVEAKAIGQRLRGKASGKVTSKNSETVSSHPSAVAAPSAVESGPAAGDGEISPRKAAAKFAAV